MDDNPYLPESLSALSDEVLEAKAKEYQDDLENLQMEDNMNAVVMRKNLIDALRALEEEFERRGQSRQFIRPQEY